MNILIADDHQLILEGFSKVLNKELPNSHVKTALDLDEMMQILKQEKIDILFQDIRFGKCDAREFIAELIQDHPEMKVIIITSSGDNAAVSSLFKMGISGYLLKSDDKHEILKAIQIVMDGDKYISPELREIRKGNRIDFEQKTMLTSREIEILRLILLEKTTKEISEALFLSEKTVESHRMNLFLKFGVKNVAGLVKKAILEGFM